MPRPSLAERIREPGPRSRKSTFHPASTARSPRDRGSDGAPAQPAERRGHGWPEGVGAHRAFGAGRGRVVLDVSEVLVAIWDGQDEHGEGGTAQIVREAGERGLPTIWIPSRPPHEPALLPPTGPPRLPAEKLAAIEARFPKSRAPE